MSAREMTAAEEWYRGLQEDYRAAAEDAMRHSHEPSPSFRLGDVPRLWTPPTKVEEAERHTYSCDRCGDMGYYSASGSWSADDVPCTDCRAIGYESSPYGPDGDWGPES